MNLENHDQIMYKLGEIGAQVDGVNRRLDTINGTLIDHEGDLKIINEWKNQSIGKIIGATAIVVIIINVILKFI